MAAARLSIEHFTYRKEGHSTSDDPTKYRPKSEPDVWPFGDPIARLTQHLIELGEWDEARHTVMADELKTHVRETYKEAEALGTTGYHIPYQPCHHVRTSV